MNKKQMSEQDIRSKFITPAIVEGGWDLQSQIREEVSFTAGKIIVRGKLRSRGKVKRADYILYYRPNIPIAIVEAKDNNHTVGSGMQQALEYGAMLDVPFVFSSNGDAFLEHDRTKSDGPKPSCNWPFRASWCLKTERMSQLHCLLRELRLREKNGLRMGD